MASHPLVTQLRFARSEFARGLDGVSAEDAMRRVPPLNCLSWMIGHLADQEHRFWVRMAQQQDVARGLNALVGYGKPASTPPAADMWDAWRTVTHAADAYLDALTSASLDEPLPAYAGRRVPPENVGTLLLRTIYHYWYHTGEAAAVRQMLGHTHLPEFVGNMTAATYRPEVE